MKIPAKKQFIALFVFIGLGIVILAFRESAQSKDIDRILIENKTSSLKVESIKESTVLKEITWFEITVRNDYQKPIAVYSFRVSDQTSRRGDINAVQQGGFLDKWLISPHEISTTKFSASSEGKVVLTIAAVIFEDGTGEGLNHDLTRLQEDRTGAKIGLSKIAPIIRDAAKKNEAASDSAIEALKNKINQLDDKEISNNFKAGFRLSKSYISAELESIQNKLKAKTGFNPIASVEGILATIESSLTKLSLDPVQPGDKKGGPYDDQN